MNKHLTLGLVVLLPLIALALTFYYSSYGNYLRLEYKLGQLREMAAIAGGMLDEHIILETINPEFDNLLSSGYIKYYYQEFDSSTVSPEHNNFWKQANSIYSSDSQLRFFSSSGITIDTSMAMVRNELPANTDSPIFIRFLAKEPEYSQLKEILNSTMTPSKTESAEKPDLLGRPHSYWVELSGNTD